ncbi:GTPase IMAP family member 4 [Paramisgurnus dabryanus]|uniref:GTPase IMAP family member 4 n=1 Tax=Paramisgurnus dabryanus TaxID=90735 RepID=UPI0031F33858
MASDLPKSVMESSSSESEIKIVLLGDTRADKSDIAKLILGCKTLKGEEIGLCTLYKSEETERKISVVDTPGWSPISIEQTAKNIKTEIVRCVSLCPPGPDVLLLVIPVKQEPSPYEMTEAQKHMELLSERVWKHTIVLFDCEEGIEESVIDKHIQSAETILEKCKQFVYRRGFSQMTNLLNIIDDLVKKNKGEFSRTQFYYEEIQPETKVFEGEPRQRRGSKEMDTSDFTVRKGNDTEEKKESVVAIKHELWYDVAALRRTMKSSSVILMGIIGALIGAVAGSGHGALGACAGLVSGIIVGGLLAVLTIYICTYIYSYS